MADKSESIGCCFWSAFLSDFPEHYAKWFDTPPTPEAWAAAKRDWRSGNTPWEAAHNAQRVAKEQAARADSKPLVHLGGTNYAEAGSALATRYGKQDKG